MTYFSCSLFFNVYTLLYILSLEFYGDSPYLLAVILTLHGIACSGLSFCCLHFERCSSGKVDIGKSTGPFSSVSGMSSPNSALGLASLLGALSLAKVFFFSYVLLSSVMAFLLYFLFCRQILFLHHSFCIGCVAFLTAIVALPDAEVVSLGGCRMIAMMPATHAAQIHGKIRKVRWLTKLFLAFSITCCLVWEEAWKSH